MQVTNPLLNLCPYPLQSSTFALPNDTQRRAAVYVRSSRRHLTIFPRSPVRAIYAQCDIDVFAGPPQGLLPRCFAILILIIVLADVWPFFWVSTDSSFQLRPLGQSPTSSDYARRTTAASCGEPRSPVSPCSSGQWLGYHTIWAGRLRLLVRASCSDASRPCRTTRLARVANR